MTDTEKTQQPTQHQAKPNQGNQAPRRSFTPLTDSEMTEITTAVGRSSGLGRIVLSVIRNRNAKVVVTDTAIGDELLTHAIELDRILNKMGNRLTRNLNVEDMQKKSVFELKAAELIQPLRNLTAEMAVDFDDSNYSVIHHPQTKKLVQEIKANRKAKEKEEKDEKVTDAA